MPPCLSNSFDFEVRDSCSCRSPYRMSKKMFGKSNRNYLYNLLRPYLWYMQLCGLYFEDSTMTIAAEDCAHKYPRKVPHSSLSWWKRYSFVILVLNWIYFLTFFVPTLITVPRMNFGSFAMMSCMIVWTFQNSVSASTMYYLSSKCRLCNEIFSKLDSLYSWKNYHLTLPRYLETYRNVGLLLCLLINLLNQVGWLFMCFDLIPGFQGMNFFPLLFFIDHSLAYYLIRIWGIMGVICTPAWTLPTCLFIHIAQSINAMFSMHVNRFRNYVSNCEESLLLDIETFRIHNEKLIDLVEITDSRFSMFLFSIFLTSLVLASATMYRTLFLHYAGLQKVLEIFWVVSEFGFLIFLSCASASINVTAQESLTTLHSISTKFLSPKRILQITLFADRLNTSSVGFTGYGFFLINKSFILTLVSGFFTYFLLLLQFGGTLSNVGNRISNNITVL